MIRTHLIRLYPNKKQLEMLAKTAGAARYCYNWGLAKWDEIHKRGERCDPFLLSRIWTKEKPDWAREVNAGSQTRALLNLGSAFELFFKKQKKHPTFHKKGKRDSFYVSNDKVRFKGDFKIHLPNIGDVNIAEKVRFSGKRIRYVVLRIASFWYVNVAVELNEELPDNASLPSVGIDVGIKHWALSSEGDILDKPRSLEKLNRQLNHAKRVRCRRQKGSKNRFKAQMREARIYKRIHDVKFDAVHKFTSRIAKSHGIVCCEDLCVKGMGHSLKKLRRAVFEAPLGEIRRQLAYKTSHYVKIDRFYPSSKRCSKCGAKKDDLALKDRTYRCPHCGLVLDRDLNAAINIRDEGLRIFTEGHSGSACGGCGSN